MSLEPLTDDELAAAKDRAVAAAAAMQKSGAQLRSDGLAQILLRVIHELELRRAGMEDIP